MKETTLHYLVQLLRRTPSKDIRHLEALRELQEISDRLLESHRLSMRVLIQQDVTIMDFTREL